MMKKPEVKVYVLLILSIFILFSVVYIEYSTRFFGGRITSSNPSEVFQLALDKNIFTNEDSESLELLANVLEKNPLHTDALIKIAELNYYDNNLKSTNRILQYANSISKMSFDHNWEIAFLAYQIGDFELFRKNLKNIVLNDFYGLHPALDQAFKLVKNKQVFIDKVIGADNINYFINHAISPGRSYKRIEICGFIDYVIETGHGHQLDERILNYQKNNC